MIVKEMLRRICRTGMTYRDISNHIGVSVRTVYRWAMGETEPKGRNFERVARLFFSVAEPNFVKKQPLGVDART